MTTDPSSDQRPDSRLERAWSENHAYVRDLAFRMLGNISDAEDAVQDAFIRLIRSDYEDIVDVRGWLVTTTSRLCLSKLGSAPRRREVSDDAAGANTIAAGLDPVDRLTLDDGIQMALLVVLQRLTPAERAAFVLHDVFQFNFEEIGKILGKSPDACRQLASRARQRVRNESSPARFDVDLAGQHRVAEQFIVACAGGSLSTLLDLLADDVVGDVDFGGGRKLVRPLKGSVKVARGLLRRFGPQTEVHLVSHPISGDGGVIALSGGSVIALLILTSESGIINKIHAIADPLKLRFATSQLTCN